MSRKTQDTHPSQAEDMYGRPTGARHEEEEGIPRTGSGLPPATDTSEQAEQDRQKAPRKTSGGGEPVRE
jgi:hypothetical protein